MGQTPPGGRPPGAAAWVVVPARDAELPGHDDRPGARWSCGRPRRSGRWTACGLAARPTVAKTEYPRRAATGKRSVPVAGTAVALACPSVPSVRVSRPPVRQAGVARIATLPARL